MDNAAGMATQASKGTRGGARKGAGRKRIVEDPRRLTLDFDGVDFARLEKLAEQRGESVASLIRLAVRQYLRRRGA